MGDARGQTAMWQWYLEWSTIAESAITDRRMLRAIGFRKPKRPGESSVEDEAEVEPPVPEMAEEAEDDDAE